MPENEVDATASDAATPAHAAPRPRRRRWRWVAVAVVLVVLAGTAGAAYRLGWGGVDTTVDGWVDAVTGDDAPPASEEPAAVAPPSGLDIPAVRSPDPLARATTGVGRLDEDAVREALQPDLSDRALGPHVLAAVAPLDDTGADDTVRLGPAGTAIPASTTKIVTSAAALFSLGADQTFETTVVRADSDDSRDGGLPRLVLVGGGDPLLASAPYPGGDEPTTDPPRADVATLAARTAAALRRSGGSMRVGLDYDASLFSGPTVNPTWESDYVPGEVAPISALWVDEGLDPDTFTRVDDPPLAAAQTFAAALADEGVRVVGAPEATTADDDARALARVSSPPLASIVERLLEVSDNSAAEVLLRHVGLAQEGTGSFTAGEQGVRRVLASAGVPMGDSVLRDGSGLSRANRLDPELLLDVLRLAASSRRPDLRPVLTGLPVAGWSGSLDDRMGEGPVDGLGRTRAKTGTLTGVTSLAGLAVGPDGDVLVFALMADRVPDPLFGFAQTALDSAAGSLGACDCS